MVSLIEAPSQALAHLLHPYFFKAYYVYTHWNKDLIKNILQQIVPNKFHMNFPNTCIIKLVDKITLIQKRYLR